MDSKRLTHADHDREIAERAFNTEVDRVYKDRKFAFESLKSESWMQRYSSLSLLHYHWHMDKDILVPICKVAFEGDERIQVRMNALGVLGSVFEYSFDPGISSYLARIVLDETCPNRVRRRACEAIEKVRTEPPIARQFQNVEYDDLLEDFEQLKNRIEKTLTRDQDELPDFDRKFIERLAWGD